MWISYAEKETDQADSHNNATPTGATAVVLCDRFSLFFLGKTGCFNLPFFRNRRCEPEKRW